VKEGENRKGKKEETSFFLQGFGSETRGLAVENAFFTEIPADHDYQSFQVRIHPSVTDFFPNSVNQRGAAM